MAKLPKMNVVIRLSFHLFINLVTTNIPSLGTSQLSDLQTDHSKHQQK